MKNIYTLFTEPDYKVFVDLDEVVSASMGVSEARAPMPSIYYLHVKIKGQKEMIKSSGPRELISVAYDNLLRAMSDKE